MIFNPTSPQYSRWSSSLLLCVLMMQLPQQSTASTTTIAIEEMAQTSWDYLSQTGPWNFVQMNQPNLSAAQVHIVEYSPAFSNTQESSWMTIIDLIQSCQLQLDPIPTLETSFNSATDTFFTELEAQEAEKETSRVQAAASLRTTIEAYRNACAGIMSQYDDEMSLRRENESKARDSVQVASVANENAAEQQKTLLQLSTSSDKDGGRTLESTVGNQFAQQDAEEVGDQTDTEVPAATEETATDSQTTETAAEDSTTTPKVIQEPVVEPEQQTTIADETADEKPEESTKNENTQEEAASEASAAVTNTSTVKVDGTKPLGKLILELDLLKNLADAELINVTYGGTEDYLV